MTFTPPGKGGWIQLGDHFPGALTAEYRTLFATTAPIGMARFMARYGVLARTLEIGFVHGHLYATPVPLFGPREMRRTPPHAAVWLMSRVHPEFRRRTRAARRTLAARPWRDVAEQWVASERAVWQARCGEVQAIDPAAFDNAALSSHLQRCRDLAIDGYTRHFELHGDDLLPLGLFVERCREWGIPADVAVGALRGASPVSTGHVEPEQWQMVTGYDLDNLTWSELGEGIRSRDVTMARAVAGDPTDLRPLVDPEHHDELAAVLADARTSVPLRDDNGVLTGAWPVGLLRRAMLEAGRRCFPDRHELAIELTVPELCGLLDGSGSATAAIAQQRRDERVRNSALVAPPTLGPAMAIPPLSALPRALARIGGAQLAANNHMGDSAATVGIGATAYTGRALVVHDAARAFDLVEPGDIIVTDATSPSWNVVLAMAGALVTTTGGLLSHAAVIARELGIAAVIGERGAMLRFTSGMTLTVDPVAGTVTESRD